MEVEYSEDYVKEKCRQLSIESTLTSDHAYYFLRRSKNIDLDYELLKTLSCYGFSLEHMNTVFTTLKEINYLPKPPNK